MQAKINPEFKNLTQQIKNVENEIKQIFDQYYSPLCNYAAKIIGDNTVAEDLVQNLFIQLWEGNK
ncbi:MAG: sigma factor [Cocleimonas sp.]